MGIIEYWTKRILKKHSEKPLSKVEEVFSGAEFSRLKAFEQYAFAVTDLSRGDYISICLQKGNDCITYHRWSQFGDFNIFITDSIDDLHKYNYRRTYGSKWFLENVLPGYKESKSYIKNWTWIDLVEFYLLYQLQQGSEIFGIPLN